MKKQIPVRTPGRRIVSPLAHAVKLPLTVIEDAQYHVADPKDREKRAKKSAKAAIKLAKLRGA